MGLRKLCVVLGLLVPSLASALTVDEVLATAPAAPETGGHDAPQGPPETDDETPSVPEEEPPPRA